MPQAAQKPLDILVVEDDYLLRHVMRTALTRRGHNVLAAGSLQETEALLDTFLVDLVICDLSLPDRDGLGVLRMLRAGRSMPHTIVISGDDRDVVIRRCLSLYVRPAQQATKSDLTQRMYCLHHTLIDN